MKKLFLLVGVVTACATLDAMTAPPKGKGELRAYYTAPGDTLPYTYTLPALGARSTGTIFSLKAVDAATSSGWRLASPACDRRAGNTTCTLATSVPLTNGVWWNTTTLVNPFVLVRTDTIAWDSATFRLVAWGSNTAANTWSRDSVVLATWRVVRRPSPPPPGTLDSSLVVAIYIRPESTGVLADDSVTFCGYARLTTGSLVTATGNMPSCALTPAGIRGRYFPSPIPIYQLAERGYPQFARSR